MEPDSQINSSMAFVLIRLSRLYLLMVSRALHQFSWPIFSIIATLSDLYVRIPSSLQCAYCNLSIPIGSIRFNKNSNTQFTAKLLLEIGRLHDEECEGCHGYDRLLNEAMVESSAVNTSSHSQNGISHSFKQ